MSDSNQPKVVSAASFTSLRLIDGGDTVAMSFLTPDGSETAILIPRDVARTVQAHLAEILTVPQSRKRFEP